jgi:hypothetical protein
VTDPGSGLGRFPGLSGTDEPASTMRPAWPGFPPGADLVTLAQLILAGVGPIFAHRTSVYVLEHLLHDAGPPGPVSGSRLLARCLAFRDARDEQPAPAGTLAPGGVIAFSEHSSAARCVRDRQPVISGHLDGETVRQLRPDSRAVLSGYSSFLLVPMTAQDTVAVSWCCHGDGAHCRSRPGTQRLRRGWPLTAARASSTRSRCSGSGR